jgi:NRPS condensation-like uncharacterized protein
MIRIVLAIGFHQAKYKCISTMKIPTKRKPINQKAAYRKKYGATAGDLILKYKAKIAARSRKKTP